LAVGGSCFDRKVPWQGHSRGIEEMSEPARKGATYDDLHHIPENMTGEIIGGELLVTPRPSFEQAHAESVLGSELLPPYEFGRGGGPGGWIILLEPEIWLGEHVLVPDLAGWKRERLWGLPKTEWRSVPPDWVCEIVSPSTARTDKVRKMPVYAQQAVPHLWLVDPANRTLDVFKLESGKWTLLASFVENDGVRAEPFQEIAIELGNLWLE
jgi:Uma2 family endonuclease